MPRNSHSTNHKPAPIGPFVFADTGVEQRDIFVGEQRDFLQYEVDAVNRFLRSNPGRSLVAKFLTVVSDGFEKEEEEEKNRTNTPVIMHAQHSTDPPFMSLSEKLSAAEVLVTQLLDNETNQLQVQLCYGVPSESPSSEPHEELNAFIPPPHLDPNNSWRTSFLTPHVCLVRRWAQNLRNEYLSRLMPPHITLLRFSIFVTLLFQFAHVLLPFAVMFHKKNTFSELYDRGPTLWQSENRPSPDPTPERMGLYLKTVGRESGDVLLHLWLGAPLRPSLQANAAENKIVVFLPFGTNPLQGKFLWPTIEASLWWLQLDDFFASGGRNNKVKSHNSTAVSKKQIEEPPAGWYHRIFCCSSDPPKGMSESPDIDLFVDMRRLIPENARRKIDLWQELSDEQPVRPLAGNENKQENDPLLENASSVKTWPPVRAARGNNRFALKRSMVSIPTLPSFQESDED